jgi:hypothetical protein
LLKFGNFALQLLALAGRLRVMFSASLTLGAQCFTQFGLTGLGFSLNLSDEFA